MFVICTHLKAKLTLPKRVDLGRTSLEFSGCPCAKHYAKMLVEEHKMTREGLCPQRSLLSEEKQTCGQQTGIRAVMRYNQGAISDGFPLGKEGYGYNLRNLQVGPSVRP